MWEGGGGGEIIAPRSLYGRLPFQAGLPYFEMSCAVVAVVVVAAAAVSSVSHDEVS